MTGLDGDKLDSRERDVLKVIRLGPIAEPLIAKEANIGRAQLRVMLLSLQGRGWIRLEGGRQSGFLAWSPTDNGRAELARLEELERQRLDDLRRYYSS